MWDNKLSHIGVSGEHPSVAGKVSPGFGYQGGEFFNEFHWSEDDVSGAVMEGVF